MKGYRDRHAFDMSSVGNSPFAGCLECANDRLVGVDMRCGERRSMYCDERAKAQTLGACLTNESNPLVAHVKAECLGLAGLFAIEASCKS